MKHWIIYFNFSLKSIVQFSQEWNLKTIVVLGQATFRLDYTPIFPTLQLGNSSGPLWLHSSVLPTAQRENSWIGKFLFALTHSPHTTTRNTSVDLWLHTHSVPTVRLGNSWAVYDQLHSLACLTCPHCSTEICRRFVIARLCDSGNSSGASCQCTLRRKFVDALSSHFPTVQLGKSSSVWWFQAYSPDRATRGNLPGFYDGKYEVVFQPKNSSTVYCTTLKLSGA